MSWLRLFASHDSVQRPEDEHRRLLAIMVADIVGYSRLMAKHEAEAFRRVRDLQRDVFSPVVVAHDGAVVKWTGDGFIASFPNAVNAVRAGAGIQARIAARGADEVALRVGINTGDTIVTRDDVYGDSVNLAARLQALAQAGEIVVSRSVRDAVKQDASVQFEALGSQTVKNIPEPIDTFRVRFDPTVPVPAIRRPLEKASARSLAKSLVTVPVVATGIGAVALAIAGGLALLKKPATIAPVPMRAERPAAGGQADAARDDGDEKAANSQFFTSVNREVRVGRSWQVDPANCEPKAPPLVQIARPPANGRLDIRQADFLLPGGSAACKGKPARGLEIFYVPNASFSGQDHFTYRVMLPRRAIDHDGTVTVK